MFRKHPLRDFMLFLLLGITVTFVFNVQAVDPAKKSDTSIATMHIPY